MIEVERLTRRYGSVDALRGVSFSVGRGEVVGLLGPNGAGKTTTMRILTTFLNPTTGTARLSGHDVLDQPLEVRRAVGYLPEQVPLYPEMRAREFLRYRAQLKDIPRRRRAARIADAMQRCGLEDVADRVLGHLSKGYRQRVGLADALLHDPPILILDEPTAGLDPLQIREVRALIRELGEKHTILISTHVMPEVEAMCSRVLIVAAGQIVLDEPCDVSRAGRAVVVEVRGPLDGLRGLIESSRGAARIRALQSEGELHRLEVEPRGAAESVAIDALREELAQRLVQNGWALRRLDLNRSNLEERFVEAVHRAVEPPAHRATPSQSHSA